MKNTTAPMPILLAIILFVLSVPQILFAQSTVAQPAKASGKPELKENNKSKAATQTEQIAAIEKYVKEIDASKKQKNMVRKILATIDSGKPGTREVWLEFKSDVEREKADTRENLNKNAFVWLRNKKIVAANFTLQDGSRDWVHFVFYHFRADGSVAKIDAELEIVSKNAKIHRQQIFSAKGDLLLNKAEYFDRKTNREIKSPKGLTERKIAAYKTVRALPFYKLLFPAGAKIKTN